MIDSMNLKLLPGNEFLTFSQRGVGIFSGITDKAHPLFTFVGRSKTALEEYNKAYERESKNPFTPLLFTADGKRDGAFYGFRYYTEAFSFHPDATISEAANKILDIIRKHGWSAPSMNYKAQTAVVTKIIGEIKSKCLPEIDLLKANEWFGLVIKTQDDFEALQKESVIHNSTSGPTLLETRTQLTKMIKDLFKMTDLKYIDEPQNQEYKGYVNAINELVTITMTSARANVTRQANKKNKKNAAAEGGSAEIK